VVTNTQSLQDGHKANIVSLIEKVFDSFIATEKTFDNSPTVDYPLINIHHKLVARLLI
jgi:hypothetical protein